MNDAIKSPGTDSDSLISDHNVDDDTADEGEPLIRNYMAGKRQRPVILSDSEDDEWFCEGAGAVVEKARRIGM